MDKKETQNYRSADSVIIGVRLSKETAAAIKQEAARRNIRLNSLILELWENYQREKKD